MHESLAVVGLPKGALVEIEATAVQASN